MATITLQINGKEHKVEAEPNMPLLWVLRDLVGLTGTKYGCGVAQCGGYCQSGMIMTTVAFLEQKGSPTDQEIEAAFAGHICRCGTYQRIKKAVQTAAVIMNG